MCIVNFISQGYLVLWLDTVQSLDWALCNTAVVAAVFFAVAVVFAIIVI